MLRLGKPEELSQEALVFAEDAGEKADPASESLFEWPVDDRAEFRR